MLQDRHAQFQARRLTLALAARGLRAAGVPGDTVVQARVGLVLVALLADLDHGGGLQRPGGQLPQVAVHQDGEVLQPGRVVVGEAVGDRAEIARRQGRVEAVGGGRIDRLGRARQVARALLCAQEQVVDPGQQPHSALVADIL
ncbi:hypothetical protein D3C81_1288220 [compost metagenome]